MPRNFLHRVSATDNAYKCANLSRKINMRVGKNGARQAGWSKSNFKLFPKDAKTRMRVCVIICQCIKFSLDLFTCWQPNKKHQRSFYLWNHSQNKRPVLDHITSEKTKTAINLLQFLGFTLSQICLSALARHVGKDPIISRKEADLPKVARAFPVEKNLQFLNCCLASPPKFPRPHCILHTLVKKGGKSKPASWANDFWVQIRVAGNCARQVELNESQEEGTNAENFLGALLRPLGPPRVIFSYL